MTYFLQYFEEVEADIFHAKVWYKDQKEGLEIEFANAAKKTIERIVDVPDIFAIRYRNIRIAHTRRFPYNIHFILMSLKIQS
jgi:hypothetical protein